MDKDLLISEIYKKTPIWDQRHKSHHNRYVLDKCWAEVAANCKVTGKLPILNTNYGVGEEFRCANFAKFLKTLIS